MAGTEPTFTGSGVTGVDGAPLIFLTAFITFPALKKLGVDSLLGEPLERSVNPVTELSSAPVVSSFPSLTWW